MPSLVAPYLIQRGRIIPEGRRNPDVCSISNAVALEYMGSSEFEYGALPKSLRTMRSNARDDVAALHLVVLDDIKDRHGNSMIAVGLHPEQREEYTNLMMPVIQGKRRCKEAPRFEDQVTPIAELPSYHSLVQQPPAGQRRGEKRDQYHARMVELLTTVWWDLDNSVMTTFDLGFAHEIPTLLRGSWSVMDANAKKTPEAAAASAPAPGR